MKASSKGKIRGLLSKVMAIVLVAMMLINGVGIAAIAAMNPTLQTAIDNDSSITGASIGMDLSNNPNVYGDVDVSDLLTAHPNLTYLNLSSTNVIGVSNAGAVTVNMSDTFANGQRRFVVAGAASVSYSESAAANLSVASLLAQVQIERADGTNIAIPVGMLETGTVTINGTPYTVSPTGTIAKADVLANPAGIYSVQLSFPVANSMATMNQNVNLTIKKSGYTLTSASGATAASVYDGGTVDIVLKKTTEDGVQTTLGNVSDYYFNLFVSANHNLTTDIERSSDGMQITIKVKAADIGSTSAVLQVYEDSTMSKLLASIPVTKFSNEDITSFKLAEYAYVSGSYNTAGNIADGSKIFVVGGTSISSGTASNLSSYSSSTMYLLEGTFSSLVSGYIPARYESQITAVVGAGYDIECEIVKVNNPNGGAEQVLALLVKAKTASATIYAYDGANDSTKPVSITLNNAGATPNAGLHLDVQVTGNTAYGYMIYQVPSIYASYSKTQIEDAINNGDTEVALVSQYGFNASNQWTEIANNGATIVEDSTIYLVALAYYEANGQLFIIPDNQINGWYFNQVDMNSMFTSTVGPAFGGTSMNAWTATTSFSSNTVVLAVRTDAYETSVNPELEANLVFAPASAANNVPIKVTKVAAKVVQYIIVPVGFTFPLGGANAYEELRMEINNYNTSGVTGELYHLNVDGVDNIAIGGTNTYYVAAVYSNYQVSDNYATISVADNVALNNWTSSAKPADTAASTVSDNHFDVTATTNAGGLDALTGHTFDITYGDGAVSSTTVTVTITKSAIDGIYLVYEDYFGNLYSSAQALYDNYSDIEELDFNFEIPAGTVANVYAVYSFSNEQYYAGVSDWKDYLVSVNDWSTTDTANLTVGLPNYINSSYPVEGTVMIAGDTFIATPSFTVGNQVTVNSQSYSIVAAASTTDLVDVIAPLVTGIAAYDAAAAVITNGAVLSGTGYTVGDSFDTAPDVYRTNDVTAVALSALTSGTGYTGTVTLVTSPADKTIITDYALDLIAGGTTTVTYSYAYSINGQSATKIIADVVTPSDNYTFDVASGKATIEEVYLVVKNNSHGTLSYQGGGVYTTPYTLGSTVDVYPVVMNSLVKLDNDYATFAAQNYISDSYVSTYNEYFSYIKAADVALGGTTWTFTGPTSSVSATQKTDAAGYLYYEVLFTDEIINMNRLNVDFDPVFVALNTSSPYSSIALSASNAGVEVYHLVDASTAYVVDVQATETSGGSPYNAGSTVDFDVEYYISTSSNANPGSGYQVSPAGYFFNGGTMATSGQSGYVSGDENKLHIDEISAPAVGSYTLAISGDTLSFVPTVAGTYKFALYTYNRAGVVAPYFAPQHFEISFAVNPQTTTQSIYYGQTNPINVLNTIPSWATIAEDGSSVLDAAALSQGVLKMANNTDATVYIDVKDAGGIALARITVNTYSATAQTPILNLTTTAASPKNMANGQSVTLYWNVNYTASNSTTYTLIEEVDSSAWSSVYAEHGNALTLNNSLMSVVAGSASGIAAYSATHTASGTTAQVWVYIDATNTVAYNYVISSSNTGIVPVNSAAMQLGETKTLYVWDATTTTLITGISMVDSSNSVVAQAAANMANAVDISALSGGSATITVYPTAGGSVNVSVLVNTAATQIYSVSGSVTDGTNPIAGAAVSATNGVSTYSATTDSNGDFTVSGLGDGTYTITVTASGYNTNSSTTATISGGNATTGNIVMIAVSSGGGGGGDTTYAITVNAGTGGSANANMAAAAAGVVVTVTATPDSDYEVSAITAVDANGNVVSVTGSGNSYTFIMPARTVTVTVTFKPEGSGTGHDNCPSAPYVDVDQSLWYHEFIDYAIANGIMVGTGANTFAPNANLSRAMMVRIFYNIEGQPTNGEAVTFTDVLAGEWYYDAVAWASANDIVTGYSAAEFGPNDNVTREQMVTMLYRYANYKGYDTSIRGELNAFADGGAVSSWATAAMQWAVGSEFVNGRDAAHLAPLGTASRVEIATIMTKYCKYYSIF